MSSTTEFIGVRVPERSKRILTTVARLERTTLTDLVCRAIDRYILDTDNPDSLFHSPKKETESDR